MGHWQYLHPRSYTTLQKCRQKKYKKVLLKMKIPHWLRNHTALRIHRQAHRGWEESGEVYFPGFPGCCDNSFLYVLLHWIHILSDAVLSCHLHKKTHTNSWMSKRFRHTILKNVSQKNRQTTKKSFHFLPFIPGDANTRLWQGVIYYLEDRGEQRRGIVRNY